MKSSFFNAFTRMGLGIGLSLVSGLLYAQDSLQNVAAAIPPIPPLPPLPQGMENIDSPVNNLVELSNNIIPVFIFLALFYAIVTMFKTFFDYRLKSRLIDKGVSDESLPHYFLPDKPQSGLYESLKWGLVAAGLGMGLIIANYVPVGLISVGVVVLFVAAGFIAYFMIITKRFNQG
jgi:hypothetical protein